MDPRPRRAAARVDATGGRCGLRRSNRAAVAAGVEPQLCVLAVDPTLPPARWLRLALELIVWLAPGEPLAPSAVFEERTGN